MEEHGDTYGTGGGRGEGPGGGGGRGEAKQECFIVNGRSYCLNILLYTKCGSVGQDSDFNCSGFSPVHFKRI